MDYFEFASVLRFNSKIWVQLLVGGICFAVVYVFQAAGLFIIARREGYKNKWMAFVPFFNTYYMGVCAQKNRVFKIDPRKFGLAVAIVEAVTFLCFAFYYAAAFLVEDYIVYTYYYPFPNNPDYRFIAGYSYAALPAGLNWAAFVFDYFFDYFLYFLEWIYLLLNLLLMMTFFKTYSAKHFVLFTILCVLFPIKGIMCFVVSRNRAVNYYDYVRAEQEKRYRMRQQYYQQQYGQNPYNGQYGGYGNDPYNRPRQNKEDPFGDFNGTKGGSDDPFDEFKN